MDDSDDHTTPPYDGDADRSADGMADPANQCIRAALAAYWQQIDQGAHPDAARERALADYADIADVLQPLLDEDRRQSDPAPGSLPLLPEDFTDIEEVGRGGMGVVYKAWQRSLNRMVAVKVILPELLDKRLVSERDEWLARFKTEAWAVARLEEHAHIVRVYEFGQHAGIHFFTMQYIKANEHGQRSLKDLMGVDNKPLPGRDAAAILETIARAVHFAHLHGVVHRDIKPSNILVRDGWAFLTDFGLAKLVEGAPDHETRTGDALGTRPYMSPEQLKDSSRVTAATDVYSLGATLYMLLVGRPPFAAASPHQLLLQIQSVDPIGPKAVNRDIDLDLDTICLKCLEKSPDRRYGTAEDLADDLGRYLRREPIVARPIGYFGRFARWRLREPVLARRTIGLLATLLLLLAVSIFGWVAVTGAYRRADNNQEKFRHERDRSFTLLQQTGMAEAARLIAEHRDQEAKVSLDTVPQNRQGIEWHLLNRRAAVGFYSTASIGNHDWGVLSLLASRDGRTFVSSGLDGRVIRWNAQTSTAIELQSGEWSEKSRLWRSPFLPFVDDVQAAETLDCFFRLCWLNGETKIAAASRHGKGVIWTMPDEGAPAERRVILEHDQPLYTVCAASDGETLLFGDAGGTLILGSSAGDDWRFRTLLRGSAILDIVRLPHEAWLVAQENGRLTVVNDDAAEIQSDMTVPGPVWDIDLSPDGQTLAVACSRDTVSTYSVERPGPTLQEQRQYQLPDDEGHAAHGVHAVRFSPDGRRLYAGDERGQFVVWERDRAVARGLRDLYIVLGPKNLARLPVPGRRRVSGIEFSGDAEQCFTAGHDPVIRRWQTKWQQSPTQFNVGRQPIVRFDRRDPNLLWVGGGDGTLALRNSVTGERVFEVRAHPGVCSGLEIGSDVPIAASYGDDNTVRFWKRSGLRIDSVASPLVPERALRQISIGPDGTRLAGYDVDDHVRLWNVGSNRLIATYPLAEPGQEPAHRGVLAFDVQGARLAVAGPGQSVYVLTGDALSLVGTPRLAQGGGATVVTWDTSMGTLYVGDTLGRVDRNPRWPQMIPVGPFLPSDVVGIALITSDEARRVVTACSSGEVRIIDPVWAGRLLTLQSEHANLQNRTASDLRVDPTGRRIALIHRDGLVEIWETGEIPNQLPVANQVRQWTASRLHEDTGLPALATRTPAVALDADGRLVVLYSVSEETDEAGPNGEFVPIWLGRENRGRLVSRKLIGRGVVRSLALAVRGNDCFATVRRPLLGHGGGWAGEFLLLRADLSTDFSAADLESSKQDLVGEPNNAGFDTYLGLGRVGQPVAVHFSHAANYLLASYWEAGQWNRAHLGRQGDGLHHCATLGPDGALHVVFHPDGVNGRGQPLWYVRAAGPAFVEQERRPIDDLSGAVNFGVTTGRDGSPFILFSRRNSHGTRQLVTARVSRPPGPKMESTVLNWLPVSVSNMVVNEEGMLSFAAMDEARGQLLLISGSHDGWTAEPIVSQASPATPGNEDDLPLAELVTLLDRNGRPVVVAVHSSLKHGSFTIFRPDR